MGVLKFRDGTRKSDKLYSFTRTCIKPTNKLVSLHSGTPLVLGQATGDTDSLDSPRLRLEGNHHLPPYNILCASPRHLHPNGLLSRNSQGGVPKLSWFGLLPLCGVITLCPDLRLGWGLKQTCSSCQNLSNSVLHSTCTHWGRVDSFPTFNGRESNCQFDSRPFFRP
jgi:hypothetical protein